MPFAQRGREHRMTGRTSVIPILRRAPRALLIRLTAIIAVVGASYGAVPLPIHLPETAPLRVAAASDTWMQDGHDAARSGWTSEEPVEPWALAWTWNGPDASGGTGNHFYNAPPEARTVMGGGNIYAPAGTGGLYALNELTGVPVWHVTATTFNATPAYDPASGAVFAGGADGNLYKIQPASGQVITTYPTGSSINKAVLILGAFAYVVTDSGQLHKVNTATMTRAWIYAGNSPGSTPPSYSSSRDAIVFATADLFIHAVTNANGAMKWHVKPSPNPAQFPYTFNRGWPVIAEQHGIVFLRMQLDPAFMSDAGIYPTSNAATRSYLQAHPNHKNLFALNLDDGSEKFIPAVGYGSTEDFINGAAFGVMGAQPVVKVWPDGTEVAYIHFRNGQSNPADYRMDGHMGEMVLDDITIPNMVAGDMRFIRMARQNGGVGYVNIIDEQEPITMAGSTIFHAHWGASESVKITDRSSALGLSYANPIATANHPTVIRQLAACADFKPLTHQTSCGLAMFQDARFWNGPGFWVYWNVVAPPGSPQPNAYSAGFLPRYTYVSDGLIVTEGNGGELLVLRSSAVIPPVITSIAPPTGSNAGGTSVTVSGAGFQSGAALSFDGIVAANNVVSGTTRITGATPAHATGAVSVTIRNPDGGTATALNGYLYIIVPSPEPAPRPAATASGVAPPPNPLARPASTIPGTLPQPAPVPRR